MSGVKADKAVEAGGQTDQVKEAEYLEYLLSRQVERLRRYDLDGALSLAEESATIAEKVTGGGILDLKGNEQIKKRIEQLYKDICLMIASQRQEVCGKLEQIRTGLRALGTYKGK